MTAPRSFSEAVLRLCHRHNALGFLLQVAVVAGAIYGFYVLTFKVLPWALGL